MDGGGGGSFCYPCPFFPTLMTCQYYSPVAKGLFFSFLFFANPVSSGKFSADYIYIVWMYLKVTLINGYKI